MPESICPNLCLLGHLVKNAYRVRDESIANLKSKGELEKAELNLLRAPLTLISRHRSVCKRCKFNDALLDAQQGRGSTLMAGTSQTQ